MSALLLVFFIFNFAKAKAGVTQQNFSNHAWQRYDPVRVKGKNPQFQEQDHINLSRLRAYTWGIGGARVARPSNPSATPPNIIEISPDVRERDVIQLSFSGHSAILLRSGELLTAGRNDSAGGGGRGSPPIDDSGQLGRNGDVNRALPVEMPGNIKVIATSCGRYHTIALAASGEIFTFGLNDRGQLGRLGMLGSTDRPCGCDSGGNCECSDDFTSRKENTKQGNSCIGGSTCRSGLAAKVPFNRIKSSIKTIKNCGEGVECQVNMRAIAVAAGRYSSATIFEDGTLVAWGLIACGASKMNENGDEEDIRHVLLYEPKFASYPREIHLIPPLKNGVKLTDVTIGYVHLVALASDGSVYTCATGFDGYAGIVQQKKDLDFGLGRKINSLEEALHLKRVPFDDPSYNVSEISAGRCHVLVRDKKGIVYSWGCARKALGRSDGEQEVPSRVKNGIEREKIRSIASGEYFSLASSRSGKIYGWGSSSNGQLGQILTKDTEKPELIEGIQGKVLRVSAGYQHAGAIVEI